MDKKICTVCWKEYTRRKGWNINEFEISKFCSVDCFHNSWRSKSDCIICWKSFFTPKCQYWKVICCSKECTKERRSENSKRRFINKDDKFWEKLWSKEKNPRWRPVWTKVNDWHWYILIKISEWNWFKNWIQEHVYNMENHIWRKIDLKKECIHHIDWNKSNNAIDNLFLTTHYYHKKLHQSIFMDLINKLISEKIVYFDKIEWIYKIITK